MISIKINKELSFPEGLMNLELDLEIEKKEFLCIYGDSGAGKTSILKIISGLMKPDSGTLSVEGEVWANADLGIFLEPQKRNVGLVFQEYNLFPNLTIAENLKYALKAGTDKEQFNYVLEILEIGELLSKKPNLLSGGQKQRVSLGRAILQKPKILMLDEPLSALDFKMRSHLQDHILQVHKELGLTTILVSHDISEIFKLSSRVIHLNNGKVINDGTPANVFTNKKSPKSFQLHGEVLRVEEHDFIDVLTILIGTEIVDVVHTSNNTEKLEVGDKVLVSTMAFNPIIQKI